MTAAAGSGAGVTREGYCWLLPSAPRSSRQPPSLVSAERAVQVKSAPPTNASDEVTGGVAEAEVVADVERRSSGGDSGRGGRGAAWCWHGRPLRSTQGQGAG